MSGSTLRAYVPAPAPERAKVITPACLPARPITATCEAVGEPVSATVRAVLTCLRERGYGPVLDTLTARYRCTAKEIVGQRRFAHLAHARAEFWAAMRADGLSFPAIAHLTGRDHTTVMHGVRAARERAPAGEGSA